MRLAEQRCRNHERREAACRCPQCRRYYCRECVTEHDDRLLCAGCLRQLTEGSGHGRRRAVAAVAWALVAAVLCWLWFFVAAEALIGFRTAPRTAAGERR